MIDHLTLHVSNAAAARAFYSAALAPLDYAPLMDYGTAIGFGVVPKPDLWIAQHDGALTPTHVAIAAKNRDAVDAFYRAAIEAGGRDNGPPGLRPHYHANYYGAFVLDADGNNIEAVCHAPA